jgi:hypothetical protein
VWCIGVPIDAAPGGHLLQPLEGGALRGHFTFQDLDFPSEIVG